ncbi:MAG TPA: hypothetical protein VF666_01835 [Pyrinomonadaceae bacterium]|jgi:uncharacterized membrane protein YagU involved in acid resistance
MNVAAASPANERLRAYGAILRGGLLAGVLDLTAALVTNSFRGLSPVRILQSIASGLLGADSYMGGWKTATLGVFLHFVIALGAAAVYYALSRRLRFLVRRTIPAGLLYGVAVYLFMNLVVLPLSAFPHQITFRAPLLVTGLIVHMLCVGLPIALVIRRYVDGDATEY